MPATVGVSLHVARSAAGLGSLFGAETLAVASTSADTAGSVAPLNGQSPAVFRVAAIGADVWVSLGTSPDAGAATKRVLVPAGREVELQAAAGEKVSARLVA